MEEQSNILSEETVLKGLLKRPDAYRWAASIMFQIPYEEVSFDQRNIGKRAVLMLKYSDTKGQMDE